MNVGSRIFTLILAANYFQVRILPIFTNKASSVLLLKIVSLSDKRTMDYCTLSLKDLKFSRLAKSKRLLPPWDTLWWLELCPKTQSGPFRAVSGLTLYYPTALPTYPRPLERISGIYSIFQPAKSIYVKRIIAIYWLIGSVVHNCKPIAPILSHVQFAFKIN